MTNSKKRREARAALRLVGPTGSPDPRGNRLARRHGEPVVQPEPQAEPVADVEG